jgi:hypothetical protein
MIIKWALQRMLKRILHKEEEDKHLQIREGINLTSKEYKQMGIRKEPNITKTTK